MDPGTKRRQEHRMAALQALSLAASCGSAVLFGSYFLARASMGTAAVTAAGVAALAGGVLLWHRRSYPASIEPADGEVEEPEPPTSETYGWEVGTFLVAAVVVPLIVLFGVLFRFWLPLGVVVAFWVAGDDVAWVSVLAAVGCTLAVLACVEFGVEHPLLRRWGLPRDVKARPREDFCPPPTSGK